MTEPTLRYVQCLDALARLARKTVGDARNRHRRDATGELADGRHVAAFDDDFGAPLPAGDRRRAARARRVRVARKEREVARLHIDLAGPCRLLRFRKRGVQRLLQLRLHGVGVGAFARGRERDGEQVLGDLDARVRAEAEHALRRRRLGARDVREASDDEKRCGRNRSNVGLHDGLLDIVKITCNSWSARPETARKAAQNRDCYKWGIDEHSCKRPPGSDRRRRR